MESNANQKHIKPKEKKPRTNISPRLNLDLKSTPRTKKLSKSYKEIPNSRPGKLQKGHITSSRSPKFSTEYSETSLLPGENLSFNNSPKVSKSEYLHHSQEFIKTVQVKTSTNENKTKSLKSLKDKLLNKRKESIGKATLKSPERSKLKKKTVKKDSKLKKLSNSPKKKAKSKGKTAKSRKKNVETAIDKNKEAILKRLAELNNRINSFKIDAFVTCKNSWEQVQRAATKIQAVIRGFLVRKVFSQTLKRLKENRRREIEEEQIKISQLDKVEKKIYKIQLKSLMEMRENDLQEVSEILKSCEGFSALKKNLEEIINRRYIILSQSISNINEFPKREAKTEHKKSLKNDLIRKNQISAEISGKDPEKTPKKHMNFDEKYSHSLSFEIPNESLLFQSKNNSLPLGLDQEEPVKTIVKAPDMNEEIKLNRVLFELEVFTFNSLFNECIQDLIQELQSLDSIKANSKVPVRHLNIFTNQVKSLATDPYSLLSYLNEVLIKTKLEDLLKIIKGHWSTFNIIFKLDDFLLENYKNFTYFTEESSLNIDHLKGIYRRFELNVINEAFSQCIEKTIPDPWVYNFDETVDFDMIVKDMRKLLEKWAVIQAGRIPDLTMINCLGCLNEDALQSAREEGLESLVFCDVKEDDELWVNLKYHETGLVLCLEDDILLDLLVETIYLA